MNRYCNPPTKATYRSPVYDVRAVPVEKVVANSYNPNVVAPPEMKLLELSIWEDGYTMPCVCYYDAEKDLYELVDGYHRYLVLKRSNRIYERERGLLPVAVLEKDISNRVASPIRRHNNANVIVFPARFITNDEAVGMLEAFFGASFEGGRHEARVAKIPVPAK